MLRQAALLVGGIDTRGREPTYPEPILDIGRLPFLDTLVEDIARYNIFDEILLLTDCKAEEVEARYAGAKRGRTHIHVTRGKEPLGTAGLLVQAANLFQDRFLLLSGNSFFDFNLLDLTARATSGLVHMALRIDVEGRHPHVVLDGEVVRAFVVPGANAGGPINGGVYVIDRSILSGITQCPASLERDVLPGLAARGTLRGTIYRGHFIDIAMPEDLTRAKFKLQEKLRRPAVFFDRDGVLNYDSGYTFEADKLAWIEGAREAVKAVNDAGYFAFVITNQSGVARGYYEAHHVDALHRWMADQLAVIGAHVDAFEYCPDHPDGIVERYSRASDRRKPAPGMITDLLKRFAVDTTRSIVIGDKPSDMEAARAAGLPGHLFSGGNLEVFVRQRLAPTQLV